MATIELSGCWQGRFMREGGEPVSFRATVPGCAHTDLLDNGLIPAYMQGYQSEDCRFIEDCVFEYERTFTLEETDPRLQVQFDCLDTLCDVLLNGQLIGRGENMFLPYTFAIGAYARAGENRLLVRFYPPARAAAGRPEPPAAFTGERVYVRRMQCTFGWDWVDRFVTMGIAGDVRLRLQPSTEIGGLYAATTAIDREGAELLLRVELDRVGEDAVLEQTVTSPEGETVWSRRSAAVESVVTQRVSVADPELWYPHGMGEQPLYTYTVRVGDGDAATEEKQVRFGIRTARVLELPDPPGSAYERRSLSLKKAPHLQEEDRNAAFSGFILLINGRRVFCKGANWVPCEPFPSAVKGEKVRELLRLAREAGLNMLRVWGGGVYESDLFYDQCDELGILTTQDFAMACAEYPEKDPWFADMLAAEARCAARRLRNHPSLVWWTGDNENGAHGSDLSREYNGRRTALEAIRPVLEKEDPLRVFYPTSPFGGEPYASATAGTCHNTQFIAPMFAYFATAELTDYHEVLGSYLSRFCAEYALMGAPQTSSLRRFLPEGNPYDFAALEYHTKNTPALAGCAYSFFDAQTRLAAQLFGAYADDADRLFKMQYVQYELVRLSLETYRRNAWYSAGLLFWMYNDCWTADGWAIVDYYGNPKAGYYAFKNAARPLLSSVTREEGRCRVYVVSDHAAPRAVRLTVYTQPVRGGKRTWSDKVTAEAPANGAACVWTANPMQEAAIERELAAGAVLLCDLAADTGESHRSWYFPKRVADLPLPEPICTVLERTAGSVTLRADSYIHAVGLDGDYVFEDNYFPMLPDEIRTIAFRPLADAADARMEIRCLQGREAWTDASCEKEACG